MKFPYVTKSSKSLRHPIYSKGVANFLKDCFVSLARDLFIFYFSLVPTLSLNTCARVLAEQHHFPFVSGCAEARKRDLHRAETSYSTIGPGVILRVDPEPSEEGMSVDVERGSSPPSSDRFQTQTRLHTFSNHFLNKEASIFTAGHDVDLFCALRTECFSAPRAPYPRSKIA